MARREAHEQRWCRPVLGSAALHAALLLGLLAARQSLEPSATTPSVILVDLMSLREEGERSGGLMAGAPATALEAEPAAGAGTARESRRPLEALASGRASASTLTDARPERTSEWRPSVAEAIEDGRPRTAPALPVLPIDPLPSPLLPVSSAVAASPEPIVQAAAISPPSLDVPRRPEPVAAELTPQQRRMLDRKLAEWSVAPSDLRDGEVTWEHDGQAYEAAFERIGAADAMGIEHVVVAVTTEQHGNRWSTRMRLKRLSFSSFAQFVDRWDPSVQIHDDEIDGRFHSNSEIYVASSGGVQPAFLGKVTTARGVNTSSSTRRVRREEVFLGGLETRVRKIGLPRHFLPAPPTGDLDPVGIQRFPTDTRIRFLADGGYVWRPLESAEPERRTAPSDEAQYLLGGKNVSLRVSGTVNGKVLVYAPEDVVIEDDIVYADDPRTGDSDDYLGLVADESVVIAGPRTTGPGDVSVHAAIYAQRRFAVRGYSAGEGATLHVLGSVAAGTVSATEPRFRTELVFDARFEERRPPGFPVTDRYDVVARDERWSAASSP